MTTDRPFCVRCAFSFVLFLALLGGAAAAPDMAQREGEVAHDHDDMAMSPVYVCPMHPQVVSAGPGKCPLCGMDLVPKPVDDSQADGASPSMPTSAAAETPAPDMSPRVASGIKHDHEHEHAAPQGVPGYVCPMHPQVVSAERGKCPICGMALVPKPTGAAEPESTATAMPQAHMGEADRAVITVSDAVVNQLGVRTAKVRRGSLTRHVEAVGSFLGGLSRSYRPANRSSDPSQSDPAAATSYMVAQVFERDAPLVRQGQVVRVRFPSLGAREWTGSVTGLETQISPTTRTMQFRVSVDLEGASVTGGMSALVTLVVDPVTDVLLVPREAVIPTEQGARVIIALDHGRFQPRAVVAEDLGEDEILIRSGLQEGERVVVSAQFLLDSEASLQAGLSRLAGAQAMDESADDPNASRETKPEGAMQ